mmetsp:Transcript_25587/g.64923  ORF Transcript_25587/g.64923 Transcript_25587/m.64923 type:complete len:245 (+) Transcript_25587:224-958(+)
MGTQLHTICPHAGQRSLSNYVYACRRWLPDHGTSPPMVRAATRARHTQCKQSPCPLCHLLHQLRPQQARGLLTVCPHAPEWLHQLLKEQGSPHQPRQTVLRGRSPPLYQLECSGCSPGVLSQVVREVGAVGAVVQRPVVLAHHAKGGRLGLARAGRPAHVQAGRQLDVLALGEAQPLVRQLERGVARRELLCLGVHIRPRLGGQHGARPVKQGDALLGSHVDLGLGLVLHVSAHHAHANTQLQG